MSASTLEAAEAVCDPVDRLLALAELAHRAAAVVRDIDAATGRAVRQALTTMSLDDLSDRLHGSAGDTLFLTAAFARPTEPPTTSESS